MRLLVLVHEYPPVGGGGGRVAQSLARGLVARGHQVGVLTSHWGNLDPREVDAGVQVWRLPVGRREAHRASLLSMAVYMVRAIALGWRLLRSPGFDVVHAHFAVPAGAAAYALHRLADVPYVLTVHLGDIPGGVPQKTDRWFRWIKPWTPPIWHCAAQVIAVSDHSRRLAQQHYAVPIRVIPNALDVPPLPPEALQRRWPPRVLFVGRFVPQKNPLQVVRVLQGLQDLDWTCAMVGDGPLREQVEQAVAQAGMTSRFTFPGWLSPEQVLELMARADVLLLPSLQEGMPLVGLQALARGLALVVSAAGSMGELVQPGRNGFVVTNPHDTVGFQRALRHLLADSQRLWSARLASLAHARRFDPQRVVQAYEQVLLQARAG